MPSSTQAASATMPLQLPPGALDYYPTVAPSEPSEDGSPINLNANMTFEMPGHITINSVNVAPTMHRFASPSTARQITVNSANTVPTMPCSAPPPAAGQAASSANAVPTMPRSAPPPTVGQAASSTNVTPGMPRSVLSSAAGQTVVSSENVNRTLRRSAPPPTARQATSSGNADPSVPRSVLSYTAKQTVVNSVNVNPTLRRSAPPPPAGQGTSSTNANSTVVSVAKQLFKNSGNVSPSVPRPVVPAMPGHVVTNSASVSVTANADRIGGPVVTVKGGGKNGTVANQVEPCISARGTSASVHANIGSNDIGALHQGGAKRFASSGEVFSGGRSTTINVARDTSAGDVVMTPRSPGSNVNVRTSAKGGSTTVVNVQRSGRVEVEATMNRAGSHSILVPSPSGACSMASRQAAGQRNNSTVVNVKGNSVHVWSPRTTEGVQQVWVSRSPTVPL